MEERRERERRWEDDAMEARREVSKNPYINFDF
jgi:hypothetical protein